MNLATLRDSRRVFRSWPSLHQAYTDSQLDDDKWKDGDQDDDPIAFSFNRTPGLSVCAPDSADVLAIFELVFTVELLSILVTETNRYAKRFLDEKFDTLGSFSQFM